jgi:hypothetical protein
MRNKSKQVEGTLNPYTESLVVHQVLGHKRGYPLTRLRADLDDINPEWIEESIASLGRAGSWPSSAPAFTRRQRCSGSMTWTWSLAGSGKCSGEIPR